MQRILQRSDFHGPVQDIARGLLGMYLVRKVDGVTTKYRIVEVEAYDGEQDLACHASKGRTKRTEVMYGPAGNWYVYLVYGMHWMLNIVTGDEGYPAAVLIRGVEDISGPGRVTKKLSIDGALNGLPADGQTGLWIEDAGVRIKDEDITATPRIGVEYAKEWARKPWRFVLGAVY